MSALGQKQTLKRVCRPLHWLVLDFRAEVAS